MSGRPRVSNVFACPDCGSVRRVTPSMGARIRSRKVSGRCHPCAVKERRAACAAVARQVIATGRKRCSACGEPKPTSEFNREHSRENIRPAHARCNLRKGTKLMHELGGVPA